MAMNMDAMLRIKADVQGENNIRRLGNSLQGLQGQAKNAAMGFNSLKGAVGGFATAIAGSAIVAGLGAIVKKSIDAGDELFNLQAKTGLAANSLIGIGNAAKLADVDMGTLGKGLTKLNVNLVKAAEGNEELARKFQALGINVKNANGQVVPADKALKQIADRFADMPDGAQKAAAAVALFGKSGADLIPLLNEGAASMEKFTYKVGEDFAARSDKFNDTITELGIKTQGFGLELTDALLPALQSILEVFSDLFNSKQDFTELFAVIKFGIRIVASAIFVTIKLVDVLIKNTVTAFEAISKALKGDFAGAGDIFKNRIGNFVEQAKQDFGQLGKIFTDAPSPGTGRRTGGRNIELDTSKADAATAARARKEASDAARKAKQEQDSFNTALKQSSDLALDLKRKTRDLQLDTSALGATGKKAIELDYKGALNAVTDEAEDLAKQVFDLIEMTGGSVKFQGLRDLAKAYLSARENQINATRTDKLKQLADEQAAVMTKLRQEAATLTRDQERQLIINERLAEIQKDMPDLYAEQKDEIDKLVTAAAGLTEEQERNKEVVDSIGNSIGSGLGSAFDGLISGTKDWGSSLKEIASGVLTDIAKQLFQIFVINQLIKSISSIFSPGGGGSGGGDGLGSVASNLNKYAPLEPFANGGIMTGDGPMPLKKYASGGIASSPQLAMFGEGSRPEAFVPLPDGRRIPVAMQGGGSSTTVNVSVDAKGTSVSGDGGNSAALGKAIAASVQAELVKQKRPGGLLA